jgi:hypothetical protein
MQASYSVNLSGGGLQMSGNELVNGDTANPYELAVAAAIAGILTTRTDANTGIVTVASGHGVTTSDTVDLYDAAGALIRKDVDVTGVTSTTISIDLGSGSDLPAANEVVNVAKQQTLNCNIDGDAIQIIGVCLTVPGAATKGRILFEDAAGDDITDLTLTANKGQIYHVAAGASNPFTGDLITVARVSNGNTTLAATLTIISMEDRTP